MSECDLVFVLGKFPEIDLLVRLSSDQLKVVETKRMVKPNQRVAEVNSGNRSFSCIRHIAQVELEGKTGGELVKLLDLSRLKCLRLLRHSLRIVLQENPEDQIIVYEGTCTCCKRHIQSIECVPLPHIVEQTFSDGPLSYKLIRVFRVDKSSDSRLSAVVFHRQPKASLTSLVHEKGLIKGR